jgi:hypothetical protein
MLSISPTNASITGGSMITITGQNFPDSVSLDCAFGSAISYNATYVSNTTIICIAPPNVVGASSLSLKYQGSTVGSSALFTYTQALAPCPAGTYVTQNGASCLVCPTGGVCPGGSSMPYALPRYFPSTTTSDYFIAWYDKWQ